MSPHIPPRSQNAAAGFRLAWGVGRDCRVTDSSRLDWETNKLSRESWRFASEKIRVAFGAGAKMHRCSCRDAMATEALCLPPGPPHWAARLYQRAIEGSCDSARWPLTCSSLSAYSVKKKGLFSVNSVVLRGTFAISALISHSFPRLYLLLNDMQISELDKKSIINVRLTSAEHFRRAHPSKHSHLSCRAPLFPSVQSEVPPWRLKTPPRPPSSPPHHQLWLTASHRREGSYLPLYVLMGLS